jgi:hypothetical protein
MLAYFLIVGQGSGPQEAAAADFDKSRGGHSRRSQPDAGDKSRGPQIGTRRVGPLTAPK